MGLPAIADAGPLHVAPQWPGGGLNGSEAARTARHDAHRNGGGDTDQEDDHAGDVEFDFLVDDLDLAIPPVTQLGSFDSTFLDSAFVTTPPSDDLESMLRLLITQITLGNQ